MKSPLKFRSPRYTRAFNSILSDPRIPAQALRIYLLIKSFEDSSGSAHPTLATLSRLSGVSDSHVQRSIIFLACEGLIRIF